MIVVPNVRRATGQMVDLFVELWQLGDIATAPQSAITADRWIVACGVMGGVVLACVDSVTVCYAPSRRGDGDRRQASSCGLRWAWSSSSEGGWMDTLLA